MIPKTIYFYWENEKMSFLRYMSIISFIYYNPDFKIILITKKNKTKLIKRKYKEEQDCEYFDGKCYWEQCMDLDITIEYLEEDYKEICDLQLDPQHTSDILTWYILGFKGGVVSDTDIIFTNPFDYEKYKDVDVSLFSYHSNFAIGFLFGSPNKIYQNLYHIAYKTDKSDYQSIGGILFRNYILMDGNRYSNINVQYICNSLIYPFVNILPWKEQLNLPYEKIITVNKDTCGIHYYGGWKETKKYIDLLTDKNYREYNNTITRYIGEILMTLGTTIIENVENDKSILDIGAGPGNHLKELNIEKHAVELNPKYNVQLKLNGYSKIDNIDMRNINIKQYYDSILLIEVIEHISIEEGLRLLEKVESKAKKVLIFTPNEFNDNKHNAKKLNEPLQEHVSVWSKDFWIKRGYKWLYHEYNDVEKVNNILYIKEF